MSHCWYRNRGDDVSDLGADACGRARSRTITLLPSSCRRMAVCRPIPEEPPVIRTVLFLGPERDLRDMLNASVAMVVMVALFPSSS